MSASTSPYAVPYHDCRSLTEGMTMIADTNGPRERTTLLAVPHTTYPGNQHVYLVLGTSTYIEGYELRRLDQDVV